MIPNKPGNKPLDKNNCTKKESSKNGQSPKTDTLANKSQAEANNPDETSSEEDSDEDNQVQIRAPNELIEEFLASTMAKKWDDALKLCQFILMYEPENKEANEFLPLIKEKLSDQDYETDDNDDSEDDQDSDSDSENDQESESEESDSSSSEETEEDEEEDDDDDVQTPRTKQNVKRV